VRRSIQHFHVLCFTVTLWFPQLVPTALRTAGHSLQTGRDYRCTQSHRHNLQSSITVAYLTPICRLSTSV